MRCPRCRKREAERHPAYGIIPCAECQDEMSQMRGPDRQVEFTTDSIREQRKTHRRESIQPFRSGEPSREFMEEYPEKTKHWDEQTRKKAKFVWKGDI